MLRSLISMLVLAALGFSQELDLRVPVSIHPELREHTRLFDKRVYRVADNVYCAVGYGIANIILVEGADGNILVDTGIDAEQGKEVAAEFAKINQKPISAIIYTHHHADHVLGTTSFVSAEDVRTGKVPIIAHDSLVREYLQEVGVAGEIMRLRAAAMYSMLLSGPENDGMNTGLGPLFTVNTPAFLSPTRTFADQLDLKVVGVELKLVSVPGEANSEIAVFLPQSRVLLSADVIQGPAYPNLYSLRGAVYRDPLQWVRSIDRLRSFAADHMVPQHGPPVSGKQEIEDVLRNYRDAIQFTRDQTVRYMNLGFAPDEIADIVQLPPHLANFRPWLREFYGSVRHSVPNIYHGNIGWFEGDPVTLKPTPRVEYARRLIALMGGRQKLLAEAKSAFAKGDPQFAAELCTYLIRVDPKDQEARLLKAAAFRKLGYATINANWRGLYLTTARALDGALNLDLVSTSMRAGMDRASGVTTLPAALQLERLPGRLKAELTFDREEAYGLHFIDTNQEFTVFIRRGVAVVEPGRPVKPYAVLSGPDATLGRLVSGAANVDRLLEAGEIKTEGPAGAAKRFAAYFEEVFSAPVTFYLR